MSNESNPYHAKAISSLKAEVKPPQHEGTGVAGVTRTLSGGVIRHQTGGNLEAEVFNIGPVEHPQPISQVHEGVVRAGIGADGRPESAHQGEASYSPALVQNNLPGFFATAKDPMTGRVLHDYSEMKDNTEIVVNGVSMPLSSALRVGLVTCLNNGQYRPVGAIDPGNPSRDDLSRNDTGEEAVPSQQEESPVVDHLSAGMRDVLNQLDTLMESPQATEVVVASGLPHALDGDMGKAAEVLAKRSGIEPEEAQEAATYLWNEAVGSAAQYIQNTYGLDGMKVFDYIGKTAPKAERVSIAQRLYYGDRKTFDEIVARYRKGVVVDHYAQQAKNKK